jgi:hypothetical protein
MEAIMRAKHLALILLVAAPTAACLPIQKQNQPPTAVVDVKLNGAIVNPTTPIPFDGSTPVTITLDGSRSVDPDGGALVEYRWMRTDVPASVRFMLGAAGAGAGAAGAGAAAPALPAFTGDPAPGVTTQVILSESGKYRFSLWVRDAHNAYSAPVSVTLKVGGFTPDMACATAYKMQPVADCRDCVCTPNAMNGCLTEFNRCFNNTDAQFSMLCSALVNCTLAKKCMGAACYTAALCMAEIDAAATYMGGTVGSCSMAAMGDTNPCAAATSIATCSTMTSTACPSVCPH